MKVRSKQLTNEERTRTLNALHTATSSIKDPVAMKAFLRDLLTESEHIMLGRRILLAREILSGKTYDEIVIEYKVGKDTILRIKKWLDDQLPGYETIIHEPAHMSEITKKGGIDKKLYATSALYRLKKKYPLHFLLFPTPKSK